MGKVYRFVEDVSVAEIDVSGAGILMLKSDVTPEQVEELKHQMDEAIAKGDMRLSVPDNIEVEYLRLEEVEEGTQ